MSTVCTMILTTFLDKNEENIAAFNHWLATPNDLSFNYHPICKVSEENIGNRSIPADIYISAFNHLHSYEILKFWQTLTIEDPDSFQIMLMDEEEESFTVYNAKTLHEQEYFVDEDTQMLDMRLKRDVDVGITFIKEYREWVGLDFLKILKHGDGIGYINPKGVEIGVSTSLRLTKAELLAIAGRMED